MSAFDPLTVWVVFYSPSDFPGLYVLRKQYVTRGKILVDGLARTAPTLDAIREFIPHGLARICRDESDPAAIVESWV